MPSIEGLKLFCKKKYILATARLRQLKLDNIDFSIISNNCWAGFIYQSYNLPYRTPTIGLYFMPDDFIKFSSQLKKYVNCELTFIKPENSKYYNILKDTTNFGAYPIGKLLDIEIVFLHYKNEKEAYTKWTRRCQRINWDNLFFKFNDQNGCLERQIYQFQNLGVKNKLCFVANAKYTKYNCIYIKCKKKSPFVMTSMEPIGHSKKINITEYINRLD
jgi:uncharacterized protein (DUF1919 family)